jgi:hypothetical protein
MIKVLSVDWDFFYPDSSWYDWGSHEENPMCYELLWHTRSSSKTREGEMAVNHYNPSGTETFWDQILDTDNLSHICITESHRRCYDLLRSLRGLELVNFDAHHDYGYQQKKKLDCSNWAFFCKKKKIISEYRLIYPTWRKEMPENDRKFKFPVSYELPKKEKYNIVFVCRSPCWTPPWADDKWLQFTKDLVGRSDEATNVQNDAEKARNLTMEQAQKEAAAYNAMIEQFYKRNKNE